MDNDTAYERIQTVTFNAASLLLRVRETLTFGNVTLGVVNSKITPKCKITL